jgi:hypothetical protein
MESVKPTMFYGEHRLNEVTVFDGETIENGSYARFTVKNAGATMPSAKVSAQSKDNERHLTQSIILSHTEEIRNSSGYTPIIKACVNPNTMRSRAEKD